MGRGYNHRTHKSLTFRLFGHSQRSTAIYPVSASSFIAIKEGDSPRLPRVSQSSTSKKLHNCKKAANYSHTLTIVRPLAFQITHTPLLPTASQTKKPFRRVIRGVILARRLVTSVVLTPITGRLSQLSPRLHQWPPQLRTRLFAKPSQPLVILRPFYPSSQRRLGPQYRNLPSRRMPRLHCRACALQIAPHAGQPRADRVPQHWRQFRCTVP